MIDQVQACKKLWQTVITQAFSEATRKDRIEATDWFLCNTDVRDVCHLAGWNPDYVLSRFVVAMRERKGRPVNLMPKGFKYRDKDNYDKGIVPVSG